MRNWTSAVVLIACALGCKSKDRDARSKAAPGTAMVPADAIGTALDAAAVEATATAPPTPIGDGPCVGTWKLELASWGKPKGRGCQQEDRSLARTFFVVRAADGRGYTARQPEGPQSLKTETRIDTTDACTLVVTELFSHRSFASEIEFTLATTKGQPIASAVIMETDHGGEEPTECRLTAKLKTSRAPITTADLAFDRELLRKELAALWNGERALTLKEFCEELPVMKTTLPRKAKVTVEISAAGLIETLAIDGVDQGKLEEVCNLPMALEEAEPIGLTNRTGTPQTMTVELELQ